MTPVYQFSLVTSCRYDNPLRYGSFAFTNHWFLILGQILQASNFWLSTCFFNFLASSYQLLISSKLPSLKKLSIGIIFLYCWHHEKLFTLRRKCISYLMMSTIVISTEGVSLACFSTCILKPCHAWDSRKKEGVEIKKKVRPRSSKKYLL